MLNEFYISYVDPKDANTTTTMRYLTAENYAQKRRWVVDNFGEDSIKDENSPLTEGVAVVLTE